jgi:hypothetical protein
MRLAIVVLVTLAFSAMAQEAAIIINPADQFLIELESKIEFLDSLSAKAESRSEMFTAKSLAHKAKGQWCDRYALLVTDEEVAEQARLSAAQHRVLAGRWSQRAASVQKHERPTIEHLGRLTLDTDG